MNQIKYNKADIESIIEKFTHQGIKKSDWTHEAHLITAFWYLNNYDYFDAVCRLKSGIVLLNTANENYNTSNSGYHETITIFWTKVISIYINIVNKSFIEVQVNDFLNSSLANNKLPLEFYNKERLMTAELRAIYVEGDLKMVGEPAISALLNAK